MTIKLRYKLYVSQFFLTELMNSSSLFYRTISPQTGKTELRPAILLLHGRGADENDLLDLASYFDPSLLVFSVRAPHKFPYGGYAWFNLGENGEFDIEQLISSRDSLIERLYNLKQNYPIDISNIFLFGFSMGAMMSLVIALSFPSLFKGVVAHSGILPQNDKIVYNWDNLGSLSFFLAHGKLDSIVPVEFGRQAYKKLLEGKANVIYREYPIQHSISDESLRDISAWLKYKL